MAESEREGVFIVTVKARNGKGRTDMAKGAVTITNLKGDALANAMMKAETKAKRRVTLSLCGLGLLDETEIETIPNARIGEPQPEVVPDPDGKARLEACQSLEDLQAVWTDLTKEQRHSCALIKDAVKERLTAKAA